MLLSAEDIFWRELFFGGKISSSATQNHAIYLTKTVHSTVSSIAKGGKVKKSVRRTINGATSAKHSQRIPRKHSEKRLICRLNQHIMHGHVCELV